MSVSNWIAGLMRTDYEAVGFLPQTTVSSRYVAKGNFVIQSDGLGKRLGYILHGPVKMGKPLFISQHLIEPDKRNRRWGTKALQVVLDRAKRGGATSIHLRCAEDLPSLLFWQAMGFHVVRVVEGGKSRNRLIAEMRLPLNLPLFTGLYNHPLNRKNEDES